MVNTEKVSGQEGVLDIICTTGFVLASRQTSPEFSGRPMVRTCSHRPGPGSIPRQGTKDPTCHITQAKKKKKPKDIQALS